MKNRFKIVILFYIVTFIACDNMNSLHYEYLEWGEKIYTASIDSLRAYPGNNRVKLTWELGRDPRITKVAIYWNDRLDSLVLPVTRTHSSRIEMEHIMNLPEGGYLFEVVSKDDKGHQSMYVEKSIDIYGLKYSALLRNRMIKSMSFNKDNELIINWGNTEESSIQYTTIKYNNTELVVPNEKKETILTGIDFNENIEVFSTHLPKDGLDNINANPKVYITPGS